MFIGYQLLINYYQLLINYWLLIIHQPFIICQLLLIIVGRSLTINWLIINWLLATCMYYLKPVELVALQRGRIKLGPRAVRRMEKLRQRWRPRVSGQDTDWHAQFKGRVAIQQKYAVDARPGLELGTLGRDGCVHLGKRQRRPENTICDREPSKPCTWHR